MQITKFAIPEVIFGNGSIKFLASCAQRLGAKRVLLVSDKGLEESGWVQKILNILEAENWNVYISMNLLPTPVTARFSREPNSTGTIKQMLLSDSAEEAPLMLQKALPLS